MEQSKLSTIANVSCALIAVGALAVSVLFVAQDRDDDKRTEQQLDAILEARTEARIATCVKDTKFAEAHNRLVMALATGGGEREIPPEVQPKVDEQLVAVPDCTAAGIKKFYGGDKP